MSNTKTTIPNMPSLPLSLDTVREAVRRICKENPANVNPKKVVSTGSGCVHFDHHSRQPSCVIGHAMQSLGITFDRLQDRSRDLQMKMVGDVKHFDHASTFVDAGVISNSTADWIVNIQSHADLGKEWGTLLLVPCFDDDIPF